MKQLDEVTRRFLVEIGLDPDDFLQLLAGRAEHRASDNLLRRLLDQMHEADTTPAEEFPSPTAPFDPDQCAKRIMDLLRGGLN
jgi:Mn-dependent DtxR family transcriptional regulator